jgi:hypothetical protein
VRRSQIENEKGGLEKESVLQLPAYYYEELEAQENKKSI